MTDHGPQRQPASEMREMSRSEISDEVGELHWLRDENVRLRAENERYAKVCKEIVNLTAFTDSYVGIYIKKLAADALRGEE